MFQKSNTIVLVLRKAIWPDAVCHVVSNVLRVFWITCILVNFICCFFFLRCRITVTQKLTMFCLEIDLTWSIKISFFQLDYFRLIVITFFSLFFFNVVKNVPGVSEIRTTLWKHKRLEGALKGTWMHKFTSYNCIVMPHLVVQGFSNYIVCSICTGLLI